MRNRALGFNLESNILLSTFKVCWRSLEKLVRAGKLKAIGCANASQVQLKEILEFSSVKPAVNSLEVHPYCRNDRLVQFCRYKVWSFLLTQDSVQVCPP